MISKCFGYVESYHNLSVEHDVGIMRLELLSWHLQDAQII